MQPLKSSTSPEIDFFGRDEELFLSLEKIQRGWPLPENVIADVNPFQHTPSDLPDGVWFFNHSGENGHTNFGFWKIKGEACSLFSNSSITGSRTTFEYFERKAPHSLKTDWLMYEYWITQKKVRENSKAKEGSSLFRVFLGAEVRQNHHMMQKMFASNIVGEENQIFSKQSTIPSEKSTETFGSTSNLQVSRNEDFRVERKFSDHPPLHLENVDDSDYLSRGDFLELHDLDIPPSPTSSSENSSCLTMSSDECFDSLDVFQEIEHEISLDLLRRDASCKSTTSAPFRLNEVVMHPSSSVFSGKIMEEKHSNPGILKEQPLNLRRGRSADSFNSSASSSGNSVPDGEKKARGKRVKKRLRNYLCFIPF